MTLLSCKEDINAVISNNCVRVYERRKLKINVEMSKVMKMSDMGEKCNMRIKSVEKIFLYSGVEFSGHDGHHR